jgi:hypothetical protein
MFSETKYALHTSVLPTPGFASLEHAPACLAVLAHYEITANLKYTVHMYITYIYLCSSDSRLRLS